MAMVREAVPESRDAAARAGLRAGSARVRMQPITIVWRHIGPNIIGPAMVLSTINLGSAILGLASMSFLGLGVQDPRAEWGSMVDDARQHFQVHPWPIVVPGAAIGLTVVAVNLLGDALRDATDPRRRRQ
ncbi:MAG: ABC transporter permease subunit [Dehalococcoidia bacterium]